ncbi:MAG: helix-turn-helix transcriptional regulator [Oscillospiraceae bacterium]|nr:helix-turn-helix transcriptional regulator [Oscillospiraceae bacterium]
MASGETDKQYSVALEENLKKALTELLLLKLLSEKDCYIGELSAAIHDRSNGALTVVFPYSAIYRLQQAGYITEKEKRSAPDGRRRQYFTVTREGKAYLDRLLRTYARFTNGITDILAGGEREK